MPRAVARVHVDRMAVTPAEDLRQCQAMPSACFERFEFCYGRSDYDKSWLFVIAFQRVSAFLSNQNDPRLVRLPGFTICSKMCEQFTREVFDHRRRSSRPIWWRTDKMFLGSAC